MSDTWSPREKKAARAIFDLVIDRAEADFLARHRAKEINSLGELWEYEVELREERKDFQMIFQYTYSSLDLCFGIAMRRGWIAEEELQGLRDERISRIKSIATFK